MQTVRICKVLTNMPGYKYRFDIEQDADYGDDLIGVAEYELPEGFEVGENELGVRYAFDPDGTAWVASVSHKNGIGIMHAQKVGDEYQDDMFIRLKPVGEGLYVEP